MSILENGSSYPSQAQKAAMALVNITTNTFQNMVHSFNDGSAIFWTGTMGATPEEIAEALGSDAREIFDLHSKLGELIASVKPELITTGLSSVGNFTMNEDGTVTVIPSPEPDPAVLPSGDVVEPEVVPSGA